LWSLGCAAIQGLEIREVSRPYLEDLSSKTNELVALSVLDGQEVVYLDKIDCSQSVRAYIPIGRRAPAYCISTGKAILAHRGDHEVIKIASSMKKFTDHTVIGREALKKHLAEIRRRGYSINFGEWHEDLGGVASPIRDRESNVVAAIGITVPIHRLAKENIDQLGRLVMKAAAVISDELGYVAFKKNQLRQKSSKEKDYRDDNLCRFQGDRSDAASWGAPKGLPSRIRRSTGAGSISFIRHSAENDRRHGPRGKFQIRNVTVRAGCGSRAETELVSALSP